MLKLRQVFVTKEIKMAAIIEHSNDKHPGMVYMRSTGDGANLIPVNPFTDIFNSLCVLLNPDKDFYNQISSAFTDVDDFNKLSRSSNQVSDLSKSGQLLKLRREKKGIWFPDPEYFEKLYNAVMEKTAPDSEARLQATEALAKKFMDTLETCLERDKTGITLEQVQQQERTAKAQGPDLKRDKK